VVLAVGERHAS